MKITKVGKIGGGQDGAIFGGILFRFDHLGNGEAFALDAVKEGETTRPFATFALDQREMLVPHSNAVFFGTEYYAEGDEFPLLYSNIYNNYSDKEDPLIGVCLVYRLMRDGESFKTKLLQMLEIGFKENAELWRASAEAHGPRPYGNFVIDKATNALYAYVMRTKESGTRYFKFRIPAVNEGEIDPLYGIKRLILNACDILDYFDTPHHFYIQGGIAHEGKIYSTEGFDHSEVNHPAIRVIDTIERKQIDSANLKMMGYEEEPEMIDFSDGICYYSDAHGTLYRVDF